MRLKYRHTRLVRTRDSELEAAERGTCSWYPRGRRRIAVMELAGMPSHERPHGDFSFTCQQSQRR